MKTKSNRDIERALADIVTGRPHEFTVGRKHLRLYPVTLAKTFELKGHMENLDINLAILAANPYIEALRLVQSCRDTCASILAIHTARNTFKDLYDNKSFQERRNLMKTLSVESMATLLMMVLTLDDPDQVMEHLGIRKERERMSRVIALKKDRDKNQQSFGGVSLFGGFIGQLKEMGYNDDEILYERPYSYLRLMLADKIATVYLTDDELNSLPVEVGGTMLDGNDPSSFIKLKELLADRGVIINQPTEQWNKK